MIHNFLRQINSDFPTTRGKDRRTWDSDIFLNAPFMSRCHTSLKAYLSPAKTPVPWSEICTTFPPVEDFLNQGDVPPIAAIPGPAGVASPVIHATPPDTDSDSDASDDTPPPEFSTISQSNTVPFRQTDKTIVPRSLPRIEEKSQTSSLPTDMTDKALNNRATSRLNKGKVKGTARKGDKPKRKRKRQVEDDAHRSWKPSPSSPCSECVKREIANECVVGNRTACIFCSRRKIKCRSGRAEQSSQWEASGSGTSTAAPSGLGTAESSGSGTAAPSRLGARAAGMEVLESEPDAEPIATDENLALKLKVATLERDLDQTRRRNASLQLEVSELHDELQDVMALVGEFQDFDQ
ncbi:hypothetical protein BDN72DRAFT_965065 [Pluteus cervinus]|uniref:Uncharacterized protein n=1 Tax=Pluteus cervinus TaxID=181527 RepID=A0ACD3A7C2_9AGAR|nr:hypothetical protein BDN72DRAFT_965065 [Pluteus cervinus]